MEKLIIIKIGSNIIDDSEALNTFLIDFAAITSPKILIHGGGKLATQLSAKLGIETKMIEGRRVTDEETVKVVTMTYAGWVNKTIVASLQSKKCNALGLCGADASLIPAIKRPAKDIDYGWVGDIDKVKVNTAFLNTVLNMGIAPVIAPISSNTDGHLLNINADTVAKTVAEAMSLYYLVKLVYCFDKNGLLLNVNDDSSVINEIDFNLAEKLKKEGFINEGMVPKIDNALEAVANGVTNVVIGHAKSILQMTNGEKGFGTIIKA
ncbi:MAG: acetylglutamate kinase [Chitinophagales bacterium]